VPDGAIATSAGEIDPSVLREVPAWLVIYVPAGSRLERRKVKGKLYDETQMPTAPSTYASVVAEASLPLLFQTSSKSFPQGTKLTQPPSVNDDNVMQVDLSKQFMQEDFWRNEQQAMLAVYAIVHTAVEGYQLKNEPLRVKLLVEGKPLERLAHMDMREPLSRRLDISIRNKTN
jgi:hypothetical protein